MEMNITYHPLFDVFIVELQCRRSKEKMNITYNPLFNVFTVELQCHRSKYGDEYHLSSIL